MDVSILYVLLFNVYGAFSSCISIRAYSEHFASPILTFAPKMLLNYSHSYIPTLSKFSLISLQLSH